MPETTKSTQFSQRWDKSADSSNNYMASVITAPWLQKQEGTQKLGCLNNRSPIPAAVLS